MSTAVAPVDYIEKERKKEKKRREEEKKLHIQNTSILPSFYPILRAIDVC